MAKINWKTPAIDAAIAIAGGTFVKGWLMGVSTVQGLLAKLPSFGGIDTQLVVVGAAVLVVVKSYFMK